MDHVSFSVGNADISTKMSDSNSEIQKKYLNETEDSDKDKKVARQNAKEAVSAYKMASLEEKRGNLNEGIFHISGKYFSNLSFSNFLV